MIILSDKNANTLWTREESWDASVMITLDMVELLRLTNSEYGIFT